MNENNQQTGFGYTEPDYYEEYVNKQTLEAKRTFSRCGIAIFAFILAANLASIIAEVVMILIFGVDKTLDLINTNVYVQYAFNVVAQYLIAFPILYFILKPMKTMKRDKSKLSLAEFCSLFLIVQFAMQFGSTIGELINSVFATYKGEEITNDVSELVVESPIWLMILVVVIIGPIIEELIFRKLLIDRLSRYGTTLAIVTSSIAFGIFHGNFYQLFYALGIGLVLGFTYAKTRNIIYPILLHSLSNFFGSVAVIPVMKSMDGFYTALDAMLNDAEADISVFMKDLMIVGSYSVITSVMVIGGLILFINYTKRKKFSIRESCEYKIPKEKAYGTAFGNIGMILLIAISALSIVLNILE